MPRISRAAAPTSAFIAGAVKVDMKRVKARKDDVVGRVQPRRRALAARACENCTVYRGPRALRVGRTTVEVGAELLTRRADLHQCRRPRRGARRCPASTRSPYLTNSSMMDARLPAAASGGRRRQLYRARVRADVPPLRQRGHRRRDGAAPDRARGRGCFRGDRDIPASAKASTSALERRSASACRSADGEIVVALDCADGAPRGRRLPSAARRRPAAQHRRPRPRPRRRRARMPAATSRSTTSSGPTCPASGRWATATAAAPSPTPPTTTTRSSPPTCSMASDARVSDRILAYALYIDPPLGRVGMTEAEVRRSGRRALVGKIADGGRLAAPSRRARPGLHEGARRRRTQRKSSAPRSSASSGDEAIHCILDTMYAKAPYTVLQRAVHIHPTVSELIPTLLGDLTPLAEPTSLDWPLCGSPMRQPCPAGAVLPSTHCAVAPAVVAAAPPTCRRGRTPK